MGDSLWLWDAPHMRGFKPLCIAGLTPSMVMRRSCSVSCGVLGRLQAMARAGGLHGLGRGRGYTPSRLLPLSPLLSLSQPHTGIQQDPKTGLKGTFWGKELMFCFVLV